MTQYWSKRLLLKGKSLNKVFLLLQNNNFPYSYIIWNVLSPISLWIVATYGLTSKKYSKNWWCLFSRKSIIKKFSIKHSQVRFLGIKQSSDRKIRTFFIKCTQKRIYLRKQLVSSIRCVLKNFCNRYFLQK